MFACLFRISYLLLLLVYAVVPGVTSARADNAARALPLSLENGARSVDSAMDWMLDPSGGLSVEEAASEALRDRFKALHMVPFPKDAGTLWLRFTVAARPVEATRQATLMLDMGPDIPGSPVLFVPQVNPADKSVYWQEQYPLNPADNNTYQQEQRPRNILPEVGGEARQKTRPLYGTVFILPEAGAEPQTCYMRIAGVPELWLSPMLRTPHDVATALERMAYPAVLAALGLVVVLCLLRSLAWRGRWRLWVALYAAAALTHAWYGVPTTPAGYVPFDQAIALISPGLALMLLPQLARHFMHTATVSRTLDSQYLLLSLPGAALMLLPLAPGFAWLVRLFPVWPLVILLLLPTTLSAWLSGLVGARRFLLSCLLPPLCTALALALPTDLVTADLLATLPLWGVALGALIVGGSGSVPLPATPSKEEELPHTGTSGELSIAPLLQQDAPLSMTTAIPADEEIVLLGTPLQSNSDGTAHEVAPSDSEGQETIVTAQLRLHADTLRQQSVALLQASLPDAARRQAEELHQTVLLLVDLVAESSPSRAGSSESGGHLTVIPQDGTPSAPAKQPLVILMDSTPDKQHMLHSLLAKLPCMLRETHTPEEAVAWQQREPAALLIFNGQITPATLDAARAIRRQKSDGATPVAMLAITDDDSQWAELRAAGFSHALSRPVSRKALQDTVLQLLPCTTVTEIPDLFGEEQSVSVSESETMGKGIIPDLFGMDSSHEEEAQSGIVPAACSEATVQSSMDAVMPELQLDMMPAEPARSEAVSTQQTAHVPSVEQEEPLAIASPDAVDTASTSAQQQRTEKGESRPITAHDAEDTAVAAPPSDTTEKGLDSIATVHASLDADALRDPAIRLLKMLPAAEIHPDVVPPAPPAALPEQEDIVAMPESSPHVAASASDTGEEEAPLDKNDPVHNALQYLQARSKQASNPVMPEEGNDATELSLTDRQRLSYDSLQSEEIRIASSQTSPSEYHEEVSPLTDNFAPLSAVQDRGIRILSGPGISPSDAAMPAPVEHNGLQPQEQNIPAAEDTSVAAATHPLATAANTAEDTAAECYEPSGTQFVAPLSVEEQISSSQLAQSAAASVSSSNPGNTTTAQHIAPRTHVSPVIMVEQVVQQTSAGVSHTQEVASSTRAGSRYDPFDGLDEPIRQMLLMLDANILRARQALQTGNCKTVALLSACIALDAEKRGLRVLGRMARCVESAAKHNDIEALNDLLPELEHAVERNRIAFISER